MHQTIKVMGKKKTTEKNIGAEFDALMKAINTQYGENSIIQIGDEARASIPVRGSGSLLVDSVLGGGYPEGRFIEIIGAESSGKAQPLSEPVLTPSGYTRMGKVKVGSKVMTPSGNITEVIGDYPQGVQDTYIMDFEDGSYTRVTLDHLFTVYEDESGFKETLTVKEILNSPKKLYVKNTPSFESEVHSSVISSRRYFFSVLRGDLSFDITSPYVLISRAERTSLIMEILGSLPNPKPGVYHVSSFEVKEMLIYLIKSLGRQLKVKRFNTDAFEITIFDNPEFKNYIKDIYFHSREECKCIKVAHPEELYITNHFIPTHNTTLALSAIAESQKNGGKSAFIDMEHSLNIEYASQLGVKVEELFLSQPSYAEEALNIAERLIESGLFDYVVIDSVAALVPKKELEGESGDAVMGLQARLMSQACRKLTGPAAKTKTTVIWINQIREKIGVMWGSPETTSGGNALKFYASQRLRISKGQVVEDAKGGVIGHNLRVKVIKNKIAPPFKETTTELIYGQGFNKTAEILNVAIDKGVVQKAGSWFKYEDSNIGQGFDKTVALLNDNPEMIEEITEKTLG